MTKQRVTAIFDIGKTNKKFFLFDKDFNQVYKSYHSFPEIEDESGFPTEDLSALTTWVRQTLDAALQSEAYEIEALNFSSYGASLVHLDERGAPLTPLYNYLKPLPDTIFQQFCENYGGKESIELATGSPLTGNLLNSGLQLYWIKQSQPDLFSQVKWSLHLPQYLSYLFTGTALSEYTSIGCHTALWHYAHQDYHYWVYKQEIDRILPPIAPTNHTMEKSLGGQRVRVGVGIHDSSSALLPYLLNESKPFLLLSTGTWNIALNPFEQGSYSKEDLFNDCLMYMRRDGRPVRATRYFLGDTYKRQVARLSSYFQKTEQYHQSIEFDLELLGALTAKTQPCFGLNNKELDGINSDLSQFASFEEAYHHFMFELVATQARAMKRAIKDTTIKKIYIDGGFTENDIFVKLIAWHFPDLKVRTTQSPLGSALGAAMVMVAKELPDNFLKTHYKMKKLKSLGAVKP